MVNETLPINEMNTSQLQHHLSLTDFMRIDKMKFYDQKLSNNLDIFGCFHNKPLIIYITTQQQ